MASLPPKLEPTLTPEEAIRFAVMLCEGTPPPSFIVKAIELAGYTIVPKYSPPPGATPPPAPPAKPRGPAICPKCNKVRNNGGDDAECERTDCPF